MTKEQKLELVAELVESFKENPNFYVADAGGMTVEQVSALRRKCFESNVKMQVIKNTLIEKALEQVEGDFTEIYPALKQQSSVLFAPVDNASLPAKILLNFRKTSDKPLLKAAYIEASVFTGDSQLKALTELKSKDQLIGEIIGLLQSPIRNVLSGLQSGGQTLAGLLKTLEEREG